MNFGLLGLSQVLGLVTGIVLSRLLGASGVGVYLWCWSAANLFGVLARLGLEPLVLKEVAIGKARERWATVLGVARFAGRTSAVVSLGLGAVTILVGWTFLDASTWATLIPAMALVGAMSVAMLASAGVRGLGAVVAASVPLQAVRPLGLLALLGVLWWLGQWRPELAMLAHLGAWIAAWLVASAFWRWKLPAGLGAVTPEQAARRWLGEAKPLLLLSSMTTLQNSAGVLLLKGLADSASTGIFGVVWQLAFLASSVPLVLTSVIEPRFAVLHAEGRRAELQRLTRFGTLASTGASVLFAGVMVAVGPHLLDLYGEGFRDGYSALGVALAGHCLVAATGPNHHLMVMTGHSRELGRWSIVSAATSVALNAALIPPMGFLGAAVATASVKLGIAIVLAVRVRRLVGVDASILSVRLR